MRVPVGTPRPCGREHHNHAKAGHVQYPGGQKSVSGSPVSGSEHGSSRSGRLFLMLLTSVETASTAKRLTGVSFIRWDSSSSSVLGSSQAVQSSAGTTTGKIGRAHV